MIFISPILRFLPDLTGKRMAKKIKVLRDNIYNQIYPSFESYWQQKSKQKDQKISTKQN